MTDNAGVVSLGTYLDWDSEFWGLGIARLEAAAVREHTTAEIAAWCRAHAIECVYLLLDEDDAATRRRAEDGFLRQVDLRVTLRRPGAGRPGRGCAPTDIRPSRPADVPHLRAIAKVSHRLTRF